MVGLAAGGITDVTARLYAEAVSKTIGQRVTVENKTGAGGGVAAADGAERRAGRLHAAGVLRLAARHGAGRQQRALRSGEGLLADHLSVQQRGGAHRAGGQPGQDHGGIARLGPQEAGRADVRHAGTGLAVAPARRQDIARRQGAVRRRCTIAAARR